jgi:hypothetical protein
LSSRHSRSSDVAAGFPGLAELSGYVSNAWDYEYGSPEAAVEAFVKGVPDLRSSAADGISELFAGCVDEADRRLLLRDLGWGYAPGPGLLDEFLIWTRATLVESGR